MYIQDLQHPVLHDTDMGQKVATHRYTQRYPTGSTTRPPPPGFLLGGQLQSQPKHKWNRMERGVAR